MESITIGQCFKGAWKDAGPALRYRPRAVLIIFALLAIITYVQNALMLLIPSPVVIAIATYGHEAIYLLPVIFIVIEFFAFAGLSVQVERHTLLGADAARSLAFFDKGFWKFVGVCLLLWLLFAVAMTALFDAVMLMPRLRDFTEQGFLADHATDLAWLAGMLALFAIALFVSIRLSLLLCHVATGGRTLWRAAWRDTRGHFWKIVATYLAIGLPMLVITIAYGVIKTEFIAVLLSHGMEDLIVFCLSLIEALWMIFAIALGAACSVWVYRRFSSAILSTT